MVIVNNIEEKGEFLHNAVLRTTIPRLREGGLWKIEHSERSCLDSRH